MSERLIGMVIFPKLTQLDMTGPYEVLARLPNTKVHLVAHSMAPVTTDRGMQIVPTVTFADCPQLDLVIETALFHCPAQNEGVASVDPNQTDFGQELSERITT